MDDYRDIIIAGVSDRERFLRLTLGHPAGDCPWEKATLRPVDVSGQRAVQVALTVGKRHIVKNYSGAELTAQLRALLEMPFGRIHLQTTAQDVHVRFSKRGKVLLTRGKASRPQGQPVLTADHVKNYPLPRDKADALLVGLGIQTPQGKIKADMFDKYRQINEFIRVIEQAADALGDLGRPLRIVDCGCGSAYLTFGAYHYLAHVRGKAACMTGVDLDAGLIAKCGDLAKSLGWPDIDFHQSAIAQYSPPAAPDIVVSLHACDLATDEALAQGVRWQSAVILAAPCCQHELHDKIDPPPLKGICRHNILRQRLADLATDAFRAAALRVMGYRTRVFEFISPQHTGRNVMIEAQKITGSDPGRRAAIAEYQQLKQFWNVTPYIENALGEQFEQRISQGRKSD